MTITTIPATLDALTPEWLTSALRARAGLGDAAVTAVRVEPIGQGVGILCQLARLELTYAGDAGAAPRSVVVKFPTLDPQTRAMVTAFRFYEREVSFYRQLGERVSLRAPHAWYTDFDPATTDFILMLEDLSDLRIGDQLAGASAEDAELIVRELGHLHAAWWNRPELETLDWLPDANSAANMAGLMLYPLAWPSWVERFGDRVSAEMHRTGEKLGGSFQIILDRFVDGPRTLCHGDLRLDNIFFGARPEEPPLRVIDWQISLRGTGAYDLGYFMTQSLAVETRRTHEERLLRLYHETLREHGVTDYRYDDLLEQYRWTALFCFAYPVMGGGLGDLANARGMELGRVMTERSAAAIEDWNAGELLD